MRPSMVPSLALTPTRDIFAPPVIDPPQEPGVPFTGSFVNHCSQAQVSGGGSVSALGGLERSPAGQACVKSGRGHGKRQEGIDQAIEEPEVTAVAVAGRAPGDEELFERCAEGDAVAGEALVSRFMPMARRLALRYRRRGEPAEDLVQVACLGLVKAVARFDHRRGAPFASYAAPTITGELKRHIRDTSWSAHVPQRM